MEEPGILVDETRVQVLISLRTKAGPLLLPIQGSTSRLARYAPEMLTVSDNVGSIRADNDLYIEIIADEGLTKDATDELSGYCRDKRKTFIEISAAAQS